jgi:hypothetical protein
MSNITVSYLILDFMRPDESKICLESIHKHSKFPFKVIYLSNGGAQDYVIDYYHKGLISKLILNKDNNGLGFGTTDLFRFCDTKYSIYLQSDQYLRRTFAKDELEYIISFIDTVSRNKLIKSVSLAGDMCQGKYSERCHIIETNFYNSIQNKPNGGAGPYHDIPWNEGYIQKYYLDNNYSHLIYEMLFLDNGCYATRQNPDGSIWTHRTDSKQMKLVKGPVKEKYVHPFFTDEEWDFVLKNQTWPEWKIPFKEKDLSFIHFKNREETIDV